MNVPQWIDQYVKGSTAGQFGRLCLQDVIDEYGGEPADQSALNLTMILGYDDSTGGRGFQPTTAPILAGTDERWHIVGGNDQLVTNMVNQLPAGTIKTGQVLTALKSQYRCNLHPHLRKRRYHQPGHRRQRRSDAVVQGAPQRGSHGVRALSPQDQRHQEPRHGHQRQDHHAVQWAPMAGRRLHRNHQPGQRIRQLRLGDDKQPVHRANRNMDSLPRRDVQRLLADTGELCGSGNQVEVHHIRALKDLNPRAKAHQPEWATRMAARRRKTLVVHRLCHEDIHVGRPTRQMPRKSRRGQRAVVPVIWALVAVASAR